jgi:hypothetical protein
VESAKCFPQNVETVWKVFRERERRVFLSNPIIKAIYIELGLKTYKRRARY